MTTSGFTLLEVLVACALLGVSAGIAVPFWQRQLDDWQLAAATRQVVMDLKQTRARAISSGATHRLRFPAPASRYALERQRPGGAYVPVAPETALPDGVQVIDCTAAGDGVGFRPRGHAAAFGTITLRNRRGVTRRVVVDIVGRLRVQR